MPKSKRKKRTEFFWEKKNLYQFFVFFTPKWIFRFFQIFRRDLFSHYFPSEEFRFLEGGVFERGRFLSNFRFFIGREGLLSLLWGIRHFEGAFLGGEELGRFWFFSSSEGVFNFFVFRGRESCFGFWGGSQLFDEVVSGGEDFFRILKLI